MRPTRPRRPARPAATLAALVALATTATALAAAPTASATTYYVNQSSPAASNLATCTVTTIPCLSIGGALAKPLADGDLIKILPDPNGFTDTYAEHVVLPNKQVTLEGAGTGTGGTRIVQNLLSENFTLEVGFGATATDLSVGPSVQAPLRVIGGTVQRVVAESPATNTAAALCIGGTILDAHLTGYNGIRMNPCRVARTRIDASNFGIMQDYPTNPNLLSGQILSSVIAGPPDAGIGINHTFSLFSRVVTLRHVTITGFKTRVFISGGNELDATNTTIAGSATSTDVHVVSGKASFIAVNHSPARTTVDPGATLEENTPIDVPPGLTADGHLAVDSALRDRGVASGYLAGDPFDTLDLDGAARVQGTAPDVGADELAPVIPPPPGGQGAGGPPPAADTTAPVITGLRLAATLRTACPKRAATAGKKRPACRTGLPLTFTLSEPATMRLTFTTTPKKKGAKRTTRVATLTAAAGRNALRFSGRIGRRALSKGKQRLTVVAVDAAGNTSAAVARTITVR